MAPTHRSVTPLKSTAAPSRSAICLPMTNGFFSSFGVDDDDFCCCCCAVARMGVAIAAVESDGYMAAEDAKLATGSLELVPAGDVGYDMCCCCCCEMVPIWRFCWLNLSWLSILVLITSGGVATKDDTTPDTAPAAKVFIPLSTRDAYNGKHTAVKSTSRRMQASAPRNSPPKPPTVFQTCQNDRSDVCNPTLSTSSGDDATTWQAPDAAPLRT
mmetsp:Transcript_13167/g.36375  ORF Transcript_13167/g.36375 Transcript_13167/m.36375 type:complete len:214 (+) Transcript_13167:214-855(+)